MVKWEGGDGNDIGAQTPLTTTSAIKSPQKEAQEA